MNVYNHILLNKILNFNVSQINHIQKVYVSEITQLDKKFNLIKY